ncbi:MAG: hypothetical protein ACI4UH_07805 [Dorea sp.]
MNNKLKRIAIGFVLPIVVTALICGVFYYKNAYASFEARTKEYERYQALDGVTLTKGNWDEYFEYVEEYVMEKDEDGNVVNVRLDAYYKMKDEYYEKLSSDTETVTFIVNADGTVKEYEILDSKTGEWNYTGKDAKYESGFHKLYMSYWGNNREICSWESETNKAEVLEYSQWYDMEKEMLILSIDEVEVLAVEGKLQFK